MISIRYHTHISCLVELLSKAPSLLPRTPTSHQLVHPIISRTHIYTAGTIYTKKFLKVQLNWYEHICSTGELNILSCSVSEAWAYLWSALRIAWYPTGSLAELNAFCSKRIEQSSCSVLTICMKWYSYPPHTQCAALSLVFSYHSHGIE